MGGLAKKVVVGSGILIGLYLALAYATNGGGLVKNIGTAASGYVKTLQGR